VFIIVGFEVNKKIKTGAVCYEMLTEFISTKYQLIFQKILLLKTINYFLNYKTLFSFDQYLQASVSIKILFVGLPAIFKAVITVIC